MNSQEMETFANRRLFESMLTMQKYFCFVFASLLTCMLCLHSMAAEDAKEQKTNNIFKSDHANNDVDNPAPQELSLDDLQDVALLLHFVSEQSINIYQEAARTPVKMTAGPNLRHIKSIPVSGLPENFLPPRQEWLVFYLGTMEPVIRQMGKQVSDIRAGSKQVVIPPSLEASLRPLWEQWVASTQELNHDLDGLVPMFDDTPPSNFKIQEQAVLLYNDVQHMEQIRRSIFLAIRSKYRTGNHDKVLISPP